MYIEKLRKIITRLVALAVVLAGWVGVVQGQPSNPMTPLPPDLEMELALSALPQHLRDGATVYTLNPSIGFEVARNGTNGFHTFVARQVDTLYRGAWPLTEYRDDILLPISFDQAGAESIMPVHFDIAAMQAAGMPPAELKETIRERYRSGYYKAPASAGVSYMLAPVQRGYANVEESAKLSTENFPHYMFYAPNISNEDIGGLPMHEPFVISDGPHGLIIKQVGESERTAINREHADLINELCGFKQAFCIDP